ncbi:magnesium/cobalt transporter CorA [Pedobacter sp. BS3]|uniref:magnesium/cobalt transporter CorA n=1 Tax=Pedobacter sp. BS3 TaxID=2567937 RepID=UPI0011EFBB18|nr:magnesium/cobalt transporter CorA [Pedobacter sp. BS3]TZF83825.1 magnesium/cobalt transporter CorA [Pedobacter sp. BS3]
MSKIKRLVIKHTRPVTEPGSSPGIIRLSETALASKINVYCYNEKELVEETADNVHELEIILDKYPEHTSWIDIQGLGDIEIYNFISKRYNIHSLVVEDITNNNQRSKLDEYEGYNFAVSRHIFINKHHEIESEQVSFILTQNTLLSFQESHNNTFKPVIERLRGGKGSIRTAGPSYMLYALTDLIIDYYFNLIYKLGDELDTIEELLYRKPNRNIMYKMQDIKRVMIMIRRAAWPERDKLNDMLRSESPLVTDYTRTFLKDAYDHCMQAVDLIESYKDVTTTLIDMNLSIISNRMNEIMKVLTIISSIFIPLTFIAGIYGMNFAYEDPITHRILKYNMPELYSPNGYIYTLIAMLLIAILQIIYFWRKGWFK